MIKDLPEFGESPNPNESGMGNAEPRVNESDKAYVAGILDGEGCLQLMWAKDRKHPRVGLHITNSCLLLLGKCQSVLQAIIQKPVILHERRVIYPDAVVKSKKKIYTIDLRNHLDLITILNCLIPYLTTKKDKAVCLVRYLEFRTKEVLLPKMSNKLSVDAVRLLDEYASRFPGVTTKRKAPNPRGEAIV